MKLYMIIGILLIGVISLHADSFYDKPANNTEFKKYARLIDLLSQDEIDFEKLKNLEQSFFGPQSSFVAMNIIKTYPDIFKGIGRVSESPVFPIALCKYEDNIIAFAGSLEEKNDPGWLGLYNSQEHTIQEKKRWDVLHSAVRKIALNTSKKVMACAHTNGTISILHYPTFDVLKTIRHHLEESKRYVTAEPDVSGLAFSPDGSHLASIGDDNLIKIWDTTSWECIKIIQAHKSYGKEVEYNADGTLLLSSALDETVKLWDVKNNYSLLYTWGNEKYTERNRGGTNNQDLSLGVFHPLDPFKCAIALNQKNKIELYEIKKTKSGYSINKTEKEYLLLALAPYKASNVIYSLVFHRNLPLLAAKGGHGELFFVQANEPSMIKIPQTGIFSDCIWINDHVVTGYNCLAPLEDNRRYYYLAEWWDNDIWKKNKTLFQVVFQTFMNKKYGMNIEIPYTLSRQILPTDSSQSNSRQHKLPETTIQRIKEFIKKHPYISTLGIGAIIGGFYKLIQYYKQQPAK